MREVIARSNIQPILTEGRSVIETETEEHERECFNCGDFAEPETGFLFECNLYCSDCCPEGYGADDRESIE